MNKIVWLASYPKSGNTWMRAFLISLLTKAEQPVDINAMEMIPSIAYRALFEEITGINISEHTETEVKRLRPSFHQFLSDHSNGQVFFKTHDAFSWVGSQALFPATATHCAIYMVRNPLDIAISYANHSGVSIDTAIEWLNSESHGLAQHAYQQFNQLPQMLSSWSTHVKSWTEQEEVACYVIRFEDMTDCPLETFEQTASAAGLDVTTDSVKRALECCSFEQLKRQEMNSTYKEKHPDCKAFFNRGECGYWRSILATEQVESIVAHHRAMMKHFGYLDRMGQPV